MGASLKEEERDVGLDALVAFGFVANGSATQAGRSGARKRRFRVIILKQSHYRTMRYNIVIELLQLALFP